ncbi:ATP-dependent helicase HrpB [Paenibacillus sp. p3-SID1389]|uniref:ATP-dependent helicase HrpB n=1 Tax=Paenibacillus sp. p3-SID1389 TaxID=2916364 RepID=UPI0021A45F37|nr:ATP-dependent helicase HrpB [Paenibacillus sp. p3-SID1389]MCT2193907.1 ATP-dependent helicase HrpB [Paenibacillus sp. p3-SID1389]
MTKLPLPIDEVIPELQKALDQTGTAVLLAEPGAGKTTRAPLSLLSEPWLRGQRILLLEPRRLAARAAAVYMASQLGEAVGETVGYRMRGDSRVSAKTRIMVVTEGILTRMLQQDPALLGTGLVIFDEFHERSLHADLGLALAWQSRQLLRDDLRLLVMSATLDARPIAEMLDGAPVVQSRGRMFPVETVYAPGAANEPLERKVDQAVRRALAEHDGSVLVFLPGAREIRRTESLLAAGGLPAGVMLAPLYGAMPQAEQRRAIEPAPAGQRKVVLATSIAESSLTVDGVTVVIDSGLRRTSLFSPRTGMSRLVTVRAARDSADQRRGRAGRTAPGVCYRLWSEAEDRLLPARTAPEMLEADLAPLALELAAWGAAAPDELAWLDAPPPAPYAQAVQLLRQLDALDAAGRITAHGRRMAALGLHPRLAHMLLRARERGLGAPACALAALLEERDLLRGPAGRDADLRGRLALVLAASGRAAEAPGSRGRGGLAAAAATQEPGPDGLRRIAALARQWEQRLAELEPLAEAVPPGAPDVSAELGEWVVPDAGDDPDFEPPDGEAAAGAELADPTPPTAPVPAASVPTDLDRCCGLLVSFAYPDRIAFRRPDGRYLMRNGRGAQLLHKDSLGQSAFLAIAEVDDEGAEGRILLAAPLEEEDVYRHHAEGITEERSAEWDDASGTVRARIRRTFGAIVLREQPDPSPSPEQITQALLEAVAAKGVAILPWTEKARKLQERLMFLHCLNPDWPDVSDETLAATAEEWLAPYLSGVRKRADLQALSLYNILEGLLTWPQQQELNAEAPTHLLVPSGSKIQIHYDGPQAPYAAVRLQEVFGMMETPRIGFGRVPITLHLLSPARRPVQVTSDLRSFWQHTYFEVKKDLKGRYPKHYWPDDPLQATATRKVRPDGQR